MGNGYYQQGQDVPRELPNVTATNKPNQVRVGQQPRQLPSPQQSPQQQQAPQVQAPQQPPQQQQNSQEPQEPQQPQKDTVVTHNRRRARNRYNSNYHLH